MHVPPGWGVIDADVQSAYIGVYNSACSGGRTTIVCSGDVSSTRKTLFRIMPLKKKKKIYNKIAQSNLGTGRVAIHGGRSSTTMDPPSTIVRHAHLHWCARPSNTLLLGPPHQTASAIASAVLPRDAMLAWYMLSSYVCLSVCLSVCLCVCLTLWYCIKTAKHKITQSYITAVDLDKFRHGMPLTEINNVDDGLLFLLLTADTLRLHLFDFLCICCKLACIISRQQIDKWSLGLTVYACANNRQLTVCVSMCFKYRSQRCCLVISFGV